MIKKKIAIIGCGNLGRSILNGLLKKSNIKPSDITATKRNIGTLSDLSHTGVKITSNNEEAIRESDIIIVALKPFNILKTLTSLKTHFDIKKHTLVSLATGISIKELQSIFDVHIPIFRAMPNTAADVGASLTCLCSNTNEAQITSQIKYCFDTIGTTVVIEEELMNAATVLGACGIAFVLRFIRAMIQGGIQIGFDEKTANKIVTNTVKGATHLLIEKKQHPEYEIDKVTTPKGCTIAGLNEMEHNGFSSALIKGIVSSSEQITHK